MTVELGTTIVRGTQRNNFSLNLEGSRAGNSFLDDDLTHNIIKASHSVEQWLYANKYRLDQQHEINLASIDTEIDKDIKTNGGTNTLIDLHTPKEIITKEKNILVKLYLTEQSQSESKNQKSNSLYGNHSFQQYQIPPASSFVSWNFSVSIQHDRLLNWAHSYEAARLAQVYAEKAKRLEDRARALAAIEAEQDRLRALQLERSRINTEKIKAANTFRTYGSLAASQPTVTAAAGIISPLEGTVLSLQAAIRSAIAAVGALLSGTVSGLLVGVSALVYSPKLANGELPGRFTFTTPLSDLAPEHTHDLAALAHTGGSIDLPLRIGAKPGQGGHSEIFLVKTGHDTKIPNSVRIVPATYDAELNVYSVTTGHTPPRTLIWTPIVSPGDSSTTLPVNQTSVPIYAGASVTPIEGRIDPHPGLTVIGFDDFITVFPADSGLPPIYVMFHTPYTGATTKGEHTNRMFNPDQAGGPIKNLDWSSATVTWEGIDLVKLHTSRFTHSDGNAIMINRLEKILRGEMSITDTDRRFYTHEIRELERYRALGILDGTVPVEHDAASAAWNNAHTASLEDYKLKDQETLMYTADALTAAYAQIEREFK